MYEAAVRKRAKPPRNGDTHSLRDKALANQLKRLKEEEQAERDFKEDLARLRDLARFD